MTKYKFILAGLFFALFSLQSHAQTANTSDKSLRFFNKTEGGVFFGIGSFKTDIENGRQKKIKNDELVIFFQTINGVKYMNRLGLGVSVGFEKWRNGFFWPIYGYISCDLKPTDNTFFANVYLGYSIGTKYAQPPYSTYDGTGAFGLIVGVGYKMKVAKKINFMYEIFYRYQSVDSRYGVYVLDTTGRHLVNTVDYKIPLHFAGFKIGVIIP